MQSKINALLYWLAYRIDSGWANIENVIRSSISCLNVNFHWWASSWSRRYWIGLRPARRSRRRAYLRLYKSFGVINRVGSVFLITLIICRGGIPSLRRLEIELRCSIVIAPAARWAIISSSSSWLWSRLLTFIYHFLSEILALHLLAYKRKLHPIRLVLVFRRFAPSGALIRLVYWQPRSQPIQIFLSAFDLIVVMA